MSMTSLSPGPLFRHTGINQTHTPVHRGASKEDVRRHFKKGTKKRNSDSSSESSESSSDESGDKYPDSPVAEVYDTKYTSAKLVMLNNDAKDKNGSHLRSHSASKGRSSRDPSPGRHSPDQSPRKSPSRHTNCMDSSSPRFEPRPPVTPRKSAGKPTRRRHSSVDSNRESNDKKPTENGRKEEKKEKDTDGQQSNGRKSRGGPSSKIPSDAELYRRYCRPAKVAAPAKRPPISMSDYSSLVDKRMSKGSRRYLWSVASVYDTSDLKRLKQNQYRDLLLKQARLGFHTFEEYEKYLVYFSGPRQQLFSTMGSGNSYKSPNKTKRKRDKSKEPEKKDTKQSKKDEKDKGKEKDAKPTSAKKTDKTKKSKDNQSEKPKSTKEQGKRRPKEMKEQTTKKESVTQESKKPVTDESSDYTVPSPETGGSKHSSRASSAASSSSRGQRRPPTGEEARPVSVLGNRRDDPEKFSSDEDQRISGDGEEQKDKDRKKDAQNKNKKEEKLEVESDSDKRPSSAKSDMTFLAVVAGTKSIEELDQMGSQSEIKASRSESSSLGSGRDSPAGGDETQEPDTEQMKDEVTPEVDLDDKADGSSLSSRTSETSQKMSPREGVSRPKSRLGNRPTKEAKESSQERMEPALEEDEFHLEETPRDQRQEKPADIDNLDMDPRNAAVTEPKEEPPLRTHSDEESSDSSDYSGSSSSSDSEDETPRRGSDSKVVVVEKTEIVTVAEVEAKQDTKGLDEKNNNSEPEQSVSDSADDAQEQVQLSEDNKEDSQAIEETNEPSGVIGESKDGEMKAEETIQQSGFTELNRETSDDSKEQTQTNQDSNEQVEVPQKEYNQDNGEQCKDERKPSSSSSTGLNHEKTVSFAVTADEPDIPPETKKISVYSSSSDSSGSSDSSSDSDSGDDNKDDETSKVSTPSPRSDSSEDKLEKPTSMQTTVETTETRVEEPIDCQVEPKQEQEQQILEVDNMNDFVNKGDSDDKKYAEDKINPITTAESQAAVDTPSKEADVSTNVETSSTGKESDVRTDQEGKTSELVPTEEHTAVVSRKESISSISSSSSDSSEDESPRPTSKGDAKEPNEAVTEFKVTSHEVSLSELSVTEQGSLQNVQPTVPANADVTSQTEEKENSDSPPAQQESALQVSDVEQEQRAESPVDRAKSPEHRLESLEKASSPEPTPITLDEQQLGNADDTQKQIEVTHQAENVPQEPLSTQEEIELPSLRTAPEPEVSKSDDQISVSPNTEQSPEKDTTDKQSVPEPRIGYRAASVAPEDESSSDSDSSDSSDSESENENSDDGEPESVNKESNSNSLDKENVGKEDPTPGLDEEPGNQKEEALQEIPRSASHSPAPRLASPEQTAGSLEQRAASPEQRAGSPEQRPVSPEQRAISPEQRATSPDQREAIHDQRAGSLGQRPVSPEQRAISPEQRTPTPEQRPVSPKGEQSQVTDKQSVPEPKFGYRAASVAPDDESSSGSDSSDSDSSSSDEEGENTTPSTPTGEQSQQVGNTEQQEQQTAEISDRAMSPVLTSANDAPATQQTPEERSAIGSSITGKILGVDNGAGSLTTGDEQGEDINNPSPSGGSGPSGSEKKEGQTSANSTMGEDTLKRNAVANLLELDDYLEGQQPDTPRSEAKEVNDVPNTENK